MGFFSNLFKKAEDTKPIPVQVEIPTNIIKPQVDQVKKLDLRKEIFKISLEKKSLQHVTARVALVIDKSGSMEDLYRNGTVQSVVERILPIGLKFDVDDTLDVWVFNNNCKRAKSVTENTFHNYVDHEIVKYSWGGTSYAPVINDIMKKYVVEDPSNIPTFVIFITDGENNDRIEAEKAIIKASNYNIFWQFIGIGHENFKFLKKLDTMEGRLIDNANFFEIKNINEIIDEKLYDLLLSEYPTWEKLAKNNGLI